MTARVLQIVDVYDALTTDRPYKKAFSITDALQTMKQEVANGWWDPQIFDQFERLVRSGAADFLSRGAAAGEGDKGRNISAEDSYHEQSYLRFYLRQARRDWSYDPSRSIVAGELDLALYRCNRPSLACGLGR